MDRAMQYFGLAQTPEEQVKKWQRTIRTEQRALERQITSARLFSLDCRRLCLLGFRIDISNEELKTKRKVKDLAKKGEVKTCRMLATEIARARRAKIRLYNSKAELGSISLTLQQQLGAWMRVAGIS